ncbi:MAG TPA: hypothetical protein VIZ17_22440 [Acetobacteraceae bacterium]
MRPLLGAAAISLIAGVAFARPPANADPALGPWFRSLMQPGTGISCCSEADCRRTDYRINGDHYEAMIQGTWQKVPNEAVLQRVDNPTGSAVVCWTPTLGIMCFVRGPEA